MLILAGANSCRLEISGKFFLHSENIWHSVRYFDGAGLSRIYGYSVFHFLDQKALKFALNLTNLKSLKLDSMFGRHFIPILKATAPRLENLTIENSFAPESEAPLSVALALLNPKTLLHLRWHFQFPSFSVADAFVRIYKDQTASPLEHLDVECASQRQFQNLLRQIASSTGSLRSLTIQCYFQVQADFPHKLLQDACKRNSSTLESLNLQSGDSETSFFKLLIPQFEENIQQKKFAQIDKFLRTNYVVGLVGLFQSQNNLWCHLVQERSILPSESDDLFELVNPIVDGPSLRSSVNSLLIVQWVLAQRNSTPEHNIWVSNRIREALDLSSVLADFETQNYVFSILCRIFGALDHVSACLVMPHLKKKIQENPTLLKLLTPNAFARILRDQSWVKKCAFDVKRIGGGFEAYGFTLMPDLEALRYFVALPGFDPGVKNEEGQLLLERLLPGTADVSTARGILKAMHGRYDLLLSLMQKEHFRAYIFGDRTFTLALLNAFGEEHIARPEVLGYFYGDGSAASLEMLRDGLALACADKQESYDGMVSQISDELWKIAITTKASDTALYPALFAIRVFFPGVPRWAEEFQLGTTKKPPVPCQLRLSLLRDVIDRVVKIEM